MHSLADLFEGPDLRRNARPRHVRQKHAQNGLPSLPAQEDHRRPLRQRPPSSAGIFTLRKRCGCSAGSVRLAR
jgi:hypothetical protein